MALLRRQFRQPGLEVLHLWHHLRGQQLQRAAPRLRVLDIVEAEDEELAEAPAASSPAPSIPRTELKGGVGSSGPLIKPSGE